MRRLIPSLFQDEKTRKRARGKSKRNNGRRGAKRSLLASIGPRGWKAMICAAAILTLAGAGYWSVASGTLARIATQVENGFYTLTRDGGLQVRKVYVAGRDEAAREELLAAVGVDYGDPILAFDPETARSRIEDLGWVRSASVHRRWPSTIYVRIEEREAIAIWQNEGTFHLIDPDGVVIEERNIGRHGHLKVVVGEGARENAKALLDLLGSEPELEARVIAAVRVGNRRWTLRLDEGIDISLPENDAAAAWAKLAAYQRDHEILSRAIAEVDMRHPDRMVVRLNEGGLETLEARTRGEDT